MLGCSALKSKAIDFAKVIMTHTRDISVIKTIDNRIFFDIPLYFEKGIEIKDVRIETGHMIITCHQSIKSSVHNNGTMV